MLYTGRAELVILTQIFFRPLCGHTHVHDQLTTIHMYTPAHTYIHTYTDTCTRVYPCVHRYTYVEYWYSLLLWMKKNVKFWVFIFEIPNFSWFSLKGNSPNYFKILNFSWFNLKTNCPNYFKISNFSWFSLKGDSPNYFKILNFSWFSLKGNNPNYFKISKKFSLMRLGPF